MKKENLDKLVQDTMSSLDGAARATPPPFLLTRINARLANRQNAVSIWEQAGWMLTRPTVAFTVLVLVLLMNILIITSTGNAGNSNNQSTQVVADEYSMNNTSSLYDYENAQP